MNKKQLTAMWIGIVVIVLMGLFPPFVDSRMADKGIYKFRGYHFFLTSYVKVRVKKYPTANQGGVMTPIFLPLKSQIYNTFSYNVGIDFKRLFLQWFFVSLLTTGAILSLRGNDQSQKSSSEDELT